MVESNSTFNFSGYLEPEEIRAIIDAVYKVSHHPERDVLLFEVLWQSGARISEVISLQVEQVGMTSLMMRNLKQFKRIQVDLPGGLSELKRVSDPDAFKEVEVSADLCTKLKAYAKANKIDVGQYVFPPNVSGDHINRIYVWRLLKKASVEAGVFRFGKNDRRSGKALRGAYPHLFRHSNAIKLMEETADISIVQQQLGHSDIRTTQGYAHTKKPKIRREVAKIDW